MTAIINVMIYDYINFIEDGYIIFDLSIIEIGDMKNFKESDLDIIDGKGKLLLPGLINSHTHIYSTLFRGLNLGVTPHNFKEILDDIWWKFDSKLDLESIELSTLVYGNESLKSGVTSLIDHHASGEIEGSIKLIDETLKKIGIKHLLCFETSDRFNIDKCIKENKIAIGLNGYFGLHASLSLSDNTLDYLKKDIKDKKIHIHVAESLLDQEDSLKKYNKRVVTRLDDYNLLTEDSLLAHCIHIDEEEAEIISKRKSYVVFNPTSNLNNAVGLLNYKLVKKYDLKVLIGTDGLGVNVAKEWQNLYYVSKQKIEDPSGVDLDWIKSKIIDSYDYFNRVSNSKIGKLKKDYNSDFILVDYNSPTIINSENIFSHIFFSIFDGLKPSYVFTDGIKRIENYNEVVKYKYNKDISKKLWERLGVKC